MLTGFGFGILRGYWTVLYFGLGLQTTDVYWDFSQPPRYNVVCVFACVGIVGATPCGGGSESNKTLETVNLVFDDDFIAVHVDKNARLYYR
jgi:hypothetical protein